MTTPLEDFETGSGRLRRAITAGVAVAALAAAGFCIYWFALRDSGPGGAKAAVQTVDVTRGRIVNSLSTTGTAASTLTSKLSFSGAGQVKSISVAVGDTVKAGQELARLDDKDAQRKVDSAQASLTTAQINLQKLQAPAKAADIAAAQQSVASANQGVASAQANLATAQANLQKAQQPPAAADVIAADAAVTNAQIALQNANNQVQTNWTALLNAQRSYCTNTTIQHQLTICYDGDVPLSDASIADLNDESRNPTGTSAQVSTILSAINGLLQANTSYVNSKNSITTAQLSVDQAKAKRDALNQGPTAADLAQLQAAINTAQAGIATAQANVASAQAKLDALFQGPDPNDVALSEQSVKQATISYQQALDAMDALVLKAPFDGTVGAVGINAGDQASASTAAVTLTDPTGVRVDLTVSETDIANLKAGEFGLATFDALSGQQYVVKIVSVSTTPTVTQGVVTYPVQALVLRGQALQDNASQLTTLFQALGGFGGGGGQSTRGQGAAATGTPAAGRTPNASRTPGTGRQGQGANGSPTANGPGGFGGGFLPALENAPAPTPGMTANVNIVLSVQEDQVLVPNAAIHRNGRASYVDLVNADGTVTQQPIVLGASDNTNTAVTSGLSEGEKVQISSATTGSTSGAAATRTTTGRNGGGGFNFGGAAPGGGNNAATGGVR